MSWEMTFATCTGPERPASRKPSRRLALPSAPLSSDKFGNGPSDRGLVSVRLTVRLPAPRGLRKGRQRGPVGVACGNSELGSVVVPLVLDLYLLRRIWAA